MCSFSPSCVHSGTFVDTPHLKANIALRIRSFLFWNHMLTELIKKCCLWYRNIDSSFADQSDNKIKTNPPKYPRTYEGQEQIPTTHSQTLPRVFQDNHDTGGNSEEPQGSKTLSPRTSKDPKKQNPQATGKNPEIRVPRRFGGNSYHDWCSKWYVVVLRLLTKTAKLIMIIIINKDNE